MTLSAKAAKALRREQEQVSLHWAVVAKAIGKGPFVNFVLWTSAEHAAIELANALTKAGFQSPVISPGRRWFRKGWYVGAALHVPEEPAQGEILLLLERVTTLATDHEGQFAGWGAAPHWP